MARRILATAVAVALASAALAAQPKLRAPVYPIEEPMPVDSGLAIHVARPQVTVRSYQVGRKQRRVALSTEEIASWIRRVEIEALRQRGFSPADEAAAGADPLERLAEGAEGLVRQPEPSEEATTLLRDACSGRQSSAVLAQHLRVKAAPRGSWNAATGQSTLGMSNSNLRGVLYDCRTLEPLWRGEMYVRTLPEVGDEDFAAAVAGIFANLEKREE